jgi:protein-S-isoprenylcysteine O-methyltransferase Ste14
MTEIARSIARVRVPLGFGCGVAALWLAHPTWASLAAGVSLAAAGESIRVLAAGHLEKGREVTRSGPYRFVGHPLYLGSAVIGAGIALASRSLIVIVMAALYLGIAFGASVRSEEAEMRAKFGREYVEFRAVPAGDAERRFSLARAVRNGEHRTVAGLAAAVILLTLKTWLRL